jgi:sialate O-acetylesterase
MCGAVLLAATAGLADVKLPAVISDHMVLQQGMKVPIWGWAETGERVRVTLANQDVEAVADIAGRWQVNLKPLEAGGPLRMTVTGDNILVVEDILVGEVWVASGQSNMQMNVGGCINAAKEIEAANYPKIRLFTVPNVTALAPQRDIRGSWSACTPRTVAGFSAVAYFFGRDIHKDLDVPVGLIHTSWGGTVCEAWMSQKALQADPDFKPILDRMEKMGGGDPNRPTALYNAMIHPLIPFAMRGIIWYQGESNARRAQQYRKLFPALIADWRKDWGEGDFPFLFVQLANFMAAKPEPTESAWAELRQAQSMTLSVPKTAQAVTIDIGDAKDIHPKNKQDVGRRLALAAEAVAYGKKVVHSGPVYDSMKIDGSKAVLKFTHCGGGLAAKGDKLTGFAIAGEDRKFVWADARIDGDSVIVSSEKVPAPVAVRYAWADNPQCNLYNKEGLPASPFRTDDWPGVTVNNK